MWGGVFLFSLSMSLTSCDPYLDDVFGEWSRPTGGSVTPSGDTPTVDDVIKYGFKVTDLAGNDKTTLVTTLKMSTDDGPVADAEVSGGKITIKATDLSGISSPIDFWFEAEIGGKNYVAKVNIDPTTLSPETDKTLSMATMGDVILADGTFAVSTTTGTKVAMITYVGSETGEATYGFKHGLALAMEDANGSNKETWCSKEVEICFASGHQYGTADDAKGDMSGIANTDNLINHAPAGHDHTGTAATAASGYSVTHPTGTSEWFLPSAGQWQKMIDGYGATNLKTDAGDYIGLKDNYYWSSTESNYQCAWTYNGGNCDFGHKHNENYYVRACLAF